MLISEIKGKNILIWGMGTEGRAAKEYIERHALASDLMTYNDDDGTEKLRELFEKTDVIIPFPGLVFIKKRCRMPSREELESPRVLICF